MLLHSYGGAKSWHIMHYEDGKSKLFKLGRFPTLGLSDARQKALDFLRDPKAHTEKPTTPDTFEHVVEQFFKIYVAKKGLRTAKIMRQRIDKHLMPAFKDREFASIRRKDLIAVLDQIEEEHGASMHDAILATFRSIVTFYSSRDEDYRSPLGPKMKHYDGKPRERVLDDNELKAFWTATSTLGCFGTLVRVLLLTGQRRQKVAIMMVRYFSRWHLDLGNRAKRKAECRNDQIAEDGPRSDHGATEAVSKHISVRRRTATQESRF